MTPSPGAVRSEARALLLLDELPGVGPRGVSRLVARFGTARRAIAASQAAFAAAAGGEAARARTDRARIERVDRGLAEADRLGMRVCTWTDAAYPGGLRHLADPPPVLFLRGRGELLAARVVTVVGARRSTERARRVAEQIGRGLADTGVTVVSGMALGVDAAAHRGALDGDGGTVAVLGRGADAPYPAVHARLFRRISEQGLVVSEFLPGTPPLPHHFPRRNRILAGLAEAIVVVEAGERSGALITVDHALDLGRDVWVVPGPIGEATCRGSNRLLVDGARPLVSVSDFLDVYGGRSPPDPLRRAPGEGAETRVLAELGSETLTVDELVERAGLPLREVLATLTALEIAGFVRQEAGMRYRAAA